MTMAIFILLNGMGLAFLVYVLFNFWNEGHRTKSAARSLDTHLVRNAKPQVHVIIPFGSHGAQGGLSVMPLQVQEGESHGRRDIRPPAGATVEMPRKRVSAK